MDLNHKLNFPSNPAYSFVKQYESTDLKEAILKKELQESTKIQTFLDFCREENIAFSEVDKLIYKLQTTKDSHTLLKNFLQKNVTVLDESDLENPNETKYPHST